MDNTRGLGIVYAFLGSFWLFVGWGFGETFVVKIGTLTIVTGVLAEVCAYLTALLERKMQTEIAKLASLVAQGLMAVFLAVSTISMIALMISAFIDDTSIHCNTPGCRYD